MTKYDSAEGLIVFVVEITIFLVFDEKMTDRRTDRRTDQRTDRRTDRRMDRRMDLRTDGRTRVDGPFNDTSKTV